MPNKSSLNKKNKKKNQSEKNSYCTSPLNSHLLAKTFKKKFSDQKQFLKKKFHQPGFESTNSFTPFSNKIDINKSKQKQKEDFPFHLFKCSRNTRVCQYHGKKKARFYTQLMKQNGKMLPIYQCQKCNNELRKQESNCITLKNCEEQKQKCVTESDMLQQTFEFKKQVELEDFTQQLHHQIHQLWILKQNIYILDKTIDSFVDTQRTKIEELEKSIMELVVKEKKRILTEIMQDVQKAKITIQQNIFNISQTISNLSTIKQDIQQNFSKIIKKMQRQPYNNILSQYYHRLYKYAQLKQQFQQNCKQIVVKGMEMGDIIKGLHMIQKDIRYVWQALGQVINLKSRSKIHQLKEKKCKDIQYCKTQQSIMQKSQSNIYWQLFHQVLNI